MIKVYINKFIFILFSVVLLLPLYTPFSISANGSLTAPFVGYNWRLIDYNFENQTTYSLNCSNSSTTGTFDTQGSGTGDSISLGPITDTSGRTYYSTGATNGGVRLTGTISINSSNGCSLSNSNTLNRYSVLEVDIILDNNYVGNVNLTIYGYNKTYYVNGNIIKASILLNGSYNETTNYGITINSYDLYLNNSNERWDFPLESYSIVNYALAHFDLKDLVPYNTYYFPSFYVSTNSIIYADYVAYATHRLIFLVDKNIYNLNTFNNNFSISKGSFSNFTYINRFYYNNKFHYIVSVDIEYVNPTDSGYVEISYVGSGNIFYMPIFYGRLDKNYFSTDFALNFGLTNTLLENLNIIANGTENSNNSVSQADDTNSQASDTFSQEEQLVNNAENDLNDKLTYLDIQNQNNSLFGNSKFIASASWVKTQFDNLTNNNAFGYLITFSLVIGISLVIIGKLRG